MKMASHEDNSQEDKLTGRPSPTKKTALEEELEERQHQRQMNYNLLE